MHRAAARGADKVVNYLAERGAILDIKNKQNRTPADLAMGVGGGRGGTGGAAHERTAALIGKLMRAPETAAR
jgi:hypothetical protein